jgi:hypothetical protein
VLNEVRVPVANPFDRCFLIVEYKKAKYMGCLLIDDLRFGNQLLQAHCGEILASIGSLNLSHTL